MKRYFADTFYFLALLNKKDQTHQQALVFSAVVDRLVTTEWVLTEVADGFASMRHRHLIQPLRELWRTDSNLTIVQANHELFEQGMVTEETALLYCTNKGVVTRGIDKIKKTRGETTITLTGLSIDLHYGKKK